MRLIQDPIVRVILFFSKEHSVLAGPEGVTISCKPSDIFFFVPSAGFGNTDEAAARASQQGFERARLSKTGGQRSRRQRRSLHTVDLAVKDETGFSFVA